MQITDSFGVRRFNSNPRKYVLQMLAEHKSPRLDDLPAFTGGLVGYFGYDYAKYAEPKLKLDAADDAHFKDMDLMLFDKVIAFDNLNDCVFLICNMQTADVENNYAAAVSEIEIMAEVIESGKAAKVEKPRLKSDFKPLFSPEQYCEMVEKQSIILKRAIFFRPLFRTGLKRK